MTDPQINSLIEKKIKDSQKDARYSTSNASYHTHNGIDSPKLKNSSLIAGVSSIIAGTNVTISPVSGVGDVTVNSSAASGVTSVSAGTGISVSATTGTITITNTGVTQLVAGSNITLSGTTGTITVSSSGGSGSGGGNNFQSFGTNGTFVGPAGITTVYVTLTGGGGGGGAGLSNPTSRSAGGGGAAAFLIREPYTVTPGSSYTVTIGLGGQGGQTSGVTGTDGGSTVFDTVTATGGKGGVGGSFGANAPGGSGGTVSASTSQNTILNTTLYPNGLVGQTSVDQSTPGIGASNPLGMGGKVQAGVDHAPGYSASGAGAGGGGGVGGNPLFGIGGNGSNGLVIVEWQGSSSAQKFGGTGSDGALSITSGTTTLSAGSSAILEKNYTSISITGTGALGFSTPGTGGSIVVLKSQGDVTITSSATAAILVTDMGGAGGAAPSAGGTNVVFGPGGGGASVVTAGNDGGGGGSAGEVAGNPGVGFPLAIWGGTKIAGGTYSTSTHQGIGGISPKYDSAFAKYYKLYMLPGSGASSSGAQSGQAGQAGGNGAGALWIECAGNLNFTGTINAKGTNGMNGGGGFNGSGGGGGGVVVILYNSLTANSGTISTTGGTGGSTNGGAGGDGFSLVTLNTEFA